MYVCITGPTGLQLWSVTPQESVTKLAALVFSSLGAQCGTTQVENTHTLSHRQTQAHTHTQGSAATDVFDSGRLDRRAAQQVRAQLCCSWTAITSCPPSLLFYSI